jgi:hypothetical protein
MTTPARDPDVTPWAWTSPAHRRVQVVRQTNFFIMTSHFSHLMDGIIPPTGAVKGGLKRDFCHTAAIYFFSLKDPISVSPN